MNIKIKQKSLLSIVLYFFLIIGYCEPSYVINKLPMIHMLFDILKVLGALYCIYIIVIRKWRLSIFLLLFACFYGYYVALAVLGIGNFTVAFHYFYTYVPLVIIVEYGLKKSTKEVIISIATIGALWLGLNTLTWSKSGLFQSQFGTAFFLGIRTRITDVALPMVALAFIYYYINKRKKIMLPFIILFSSVAFFLLEDVSTGIFCIMLLLILLILGNKITKNFMIPVYILTLVLNISMVFLRLQNYFAWILEDMLHEDLTFSNRIYIWDAAILQIFQSFKTVLIGHGVGTNPSFFVENMGETHNQYLKYLFNGGLISCTLFILILIMVLAKLEKYKEHKSSVVLGGMLIIISVAMLTESCCENAYFAILLAVSTNISAVAAIEVKRRSKIKLVKG